LIWIDLDLYDKFKSKVHDFSLKEDIWHEKILILAL